MISNQSLLAEISESIHRSDENALAYLFGSRARKDNGNDSDWDILILVKDEKVSNDIDDKFRDSLYNLEVESGQIISTLIYPQKYWNQVLLHSPLYKEIAKEGIEI